MLIVVSKRTVLIVDDHDEFRRFSRTLLEAHGFDVTGEAPDGEAALAAAREQHPEIVLLDVQLPGLDGFEVARQLATGRNAPRVVLTSTREASDYGHRLSDAPVVGFVPKQELSGAAIDAALARVAT
jgi:two-component system, NarL family, nitrate/nitrite response regulator NarL